MPMSDVTGRRYRSGSVDRRDHRKRPIERRGAVLRGFRTVRSCSRLVVLCDRASGAEIDSVADLDNRIAGWNLFGHRGDQRGGGDRRPERGSRCQQHSSGTAVQGAHRRHAEAAGRTYRFAAVFSINPAGPIDWGDLAGGAGYFDQAHFGHEFRAFSSWTVTVSRSESLTGPRIANPTTSPPLSATVV